MNDSELDDLLHRINSGQVSSKEIVRHCAFGRISYDGTKWVRYIENPIWKKLESECKSGEELYQKAKDAGLLKSNFKLDSNGNII